MTYRSFTVYIVTSLWLVSGREDRNSDSEEEEKPQSLKIKSLDLTSYELTLNKL